MSSTIAGKQKSGSQQDEVKILFYPVSFNVPFIKRDGKAVLKLSSSAPEGMKELTQNITNTSFKITIVSKNQEIVPYSVINRNEETAEILIQLIFRNI